MYRSLILFCVLAVLAHTGDAQVLTRSGPASRSWWRRLQLRFWRLLHLLRLLCLPSRCCLLPAGARTSLLMSRERAPGVLSEARPECLVLAVLVRLLAWVMVHRQDRGPGQVLTAFICIPIL